MTQINYATAGTEPGFETRSGELSGRIVIVVNRVSRKHKRDVINLIAQKLQGPKRHVEVMESHGPGHICEIARTIVAQAILIAGGDGSVNEAVRGLLKRSYPRPLLGVIPQGSANILRHELALPTSVSGLVDIFLGGRIGHLHIGLANERPFTLMASAGFDAEVVKTVSKPLKQRIGRLAYVYAALRLVICYKGDDIEVNTGDEIFLAKLIIVTKSKYYGGRFVLDRETSAIRPGLKLIAVSDVGFVSLIKLGIGLIGGRLNDATLIRRMPVRLVELRSRREVATQIDGDQLGATPMVISECSETLEVFMGSSGIVNLASHNRFRGRFGFFGRRVNP
ncbi:MAG: diacylglycerol kinase family protein [Methylocella sp.]